MLRMFLAIFALAIGAACLGDVDLGRQKLSVIWHAFLQLSVHGSAPQPTNQLNKRHWWWLNFQGGGEIQDTDSDIEMTIKWK